MVSRSFIALLACCVLVACTAHAQEKKNKQNREEEARARLPNDPDLLAIHLEFVKSAEKLAAKYEKEKEWSKAKACYEEILKLVPQYPVAKQRIGELFQMEATAAHHAVKVKANQRWQDSGINVIEGKPLTIRAGGTWKFKLMAEVGPQGLPIPKELREFDPGSLVGMIVSPNGEDRKAFMIGAEKQLLAPASGRLVLQMYDNDVSDNEGEIAVEILGTFLADAKPGKEKEKDKDK